MMPRVAAAAVAALLLAGSLCLMAADAASGAGAARGAAESSPGLGTIELDRVARVLTVPGRFLSSAEPVQQAAEAPPPPGADLLEYLAVKRNGYKAYEALIELDTTAAEFNLACILIGLDAERATLPEYHFDPTPLKGDAVELWVEWEQDGETRRVPPAQLILVDGEPANDHDWVYTGSSFIGPGQFLAEQTGALIGFVHDRDSIIEHRRGIGLGASRPPKLNRALLPPEGTPIRVVVRNLAEPSTEAPRSPGSARSP
jgi:hypothetical protein